MALKIVFPDYEGAASSGEFGAQLATQYPEAALIPVLNGKNREKLEQIAKALTKPFKPLMVTGEGLLAAMFEGYEHIAQESGGETVVKLDTAEHPIEWIKQLAVQAETIKGFVVGDLEFTDPKLLVEGTSDWFAHTHVFPALYAAATRKKLPLSGAHGFQAFGPGVLPVVLARAKDILKEVEQCWGSKPRFGLDGALALSAALQGLPVKRIAIPGSIKRNRPVDKIAEQTDAAIKMCLASERVFGRAG
jgi:hypothetical protein